MNISLPSIRSGLIVAVAVALPTVGGPVQRVGAQAPAASQLGTISFPTSAKPAAQAPFLTGTKALYNFEFDLAGDAFRESQHADPAFALAYWGEAMSYNHPLWAEQDQAAARRVLERLAPTAAERAAKAPAGKERELIEAVDILFGTGDKLTRDLAYAGAMGRMHARYSADDEIACFYALSLLGTARAGEKSTRNSMQAAAIVQDIFQRHPQHPGAAHYIIHSFDDPDHAILSLPAARAYSKIAPSAAHALHMPSHIFVQLGLWDDVVASNVVAYKAANDLADRKNLPRGREDGEGGGRQGHEPARARRLRVDESAPGGRNREVGEAGAAERSGQRRRRAGLRRQRGVRARGRPERRQARRHGHGEPGPREAEGDAHAGGV